MNKFSKFVIHCILMALNLIAPTQINLKDRLNRVAYKALNRRVEFVKL